MFNTLIKNLAYVFVVVEFVKFYDLQFYFDFNDNPPAYLERECVKRLRGEPPDWRVYYVAISQWLYFLYCFALLLTPYWIVGVYFLIVCLVVAKHFKMYLHEFTIIDTLISVFLLMIVITLPL